MKSLDIEENLENNIIYAKLKKNNNKKKKKKRIHLLKK